MVVIEGMKFGRLLVQRLAFKKNHGKYWYCICDCGQTTEIYQGSLTRKVGATRSCGCLRDENTGRLNRLEVGQAAKNRRLSDYRKKAERQGLEFDLTDEDFFSLTQQNCHYCGISPYRSSHTKGTHYYGDFVYNGVDRIDSKKGYIKENCVPCCTTCNLGKCDSPYGEFIEYLNQVATFRRTQLN